MIAVKKNGQLEEALEVSLTGYHGLRITCRLNAKPPPEALGGKAYEQTASH